MSRNTLSVRHLGQDEGKRANYRAFAVSGITFEHFGVATTAPVSKTQTLEDGVPADDRSSRREKEEYVRYCVICGLAI